MLLCNLKSRCLDVLVGMKTGSRFGVVSSARLDDTIKQRHEGHRVLSVLPSCCVSLEALAPQTLTRL